MAFTPYTITSYTNDTWTTIYTAASDSMFYSMSISNVGSSTTTVQVQITDGSDAELHRILPPKGLTADNNISNAEIRQALTSGWKVKVKASAASVQFMITVQTGINA